MLERGFLVCVRGRIDMCKHRKRDVDYRHWADDELVRSYQERNDNLALAELYRRYNRMIQAVGHHYFLLKAGDEDLLQEGRLGFFKAVKGYELHREAPFSAFAKRCVRCQYISAIKTANRQKHRPLNSSVSLHAVVHLQDSEVTFMDILADRSGMEASDKMIQQEDYETCHDFIRKSLSQAEFEAVLHYLNGSSYEEISRIMGRSVKSVDNALQRAKHTIRTGIKARGDITLKMLRQYFHRLLCFEEMGPL